MIVTSVSVLTFFNGRESCGGVSQVTPSLPHVVFGLYILSQQQNFLQMCCRTLGHSNLTWQVLHSDACLLSRSYCLILLLSHFWKKNIITQYHHQVTLCFPLVKINEFILQSLSGGSITVLMAFISSF